jgi:anti-anti-sigma factor
VSSQGSARNSPAPLTAVAGTVLPMTTTAQPVFGTIDVEDEGGVAVLRLRGEIDQVTVEAYDRTHLAAGAATVIDASGVTFMDCRGLRFLLRQSAAARRAGRAAALRQPPRVVRRVLCATGADSLFTITA